MTQIKHLVVGQYPDDEYEHSLVCLDNGTLEGGSVVAEVHHPDYAKLFAMAPNMLATLREIAGLTPCNDTDLRRRAMQCINRLKGCDIAEKAEISP